jgi:hypothetical protein
MRPRVVGAFIVAACSGLGISCTNVVSSVVESLVSRMETER